MPLYPHYTNEASPQTDEACRVRLRLWATRLSIPEAVDYKQLRSYRARLIPSRMVDPQLSRIERLVLDAYVDLTTIDYVRKEDGKRIGLVNGPYGISY